MQHLNTLWQLVNAASDIKEMTRHRQTYYFGTNGPITFYLRAEQVAVRVVRWAQPKVEVGVTLQAAFGWRIITDQDEAGVYVVARRRMLVGGLSSGVFNIIVPTDTYLMLHLEQSQVILDQVSGTLNIPPTSEAQTTALLAAKV